MENLGVLFFMLLSLSACSVYKDSKTQYQNESLLPTAEAFIDTFYSFNSIALEGALSQASSSIPSVVYYQGWAEGGNYKIVARKPCVIQELNVASCSVTVEDDPMLALGIDFNVTDTFTISFIDGVIVAVETSSNDMQIYFDARDWVLTELPELVAEACEGFFNGGSTPNECARLMAEGYRRYAASEEFPEL
ncbi:MAG TPA: hypothetical protein EYG31_04805 [Porticoccaceae bacterium]|jgi:hypothetical protein|nr:hypothetical protein [Porticoccaceae bacterium]